ncbi:unnamed protein product [Nezara viridula]|uniref:Chitin-binding type-2 domain-containing protein n=1 Tax=Nezara viridula TaxID=85310 RepID=A0A9P0H7B9_NEZVI|nr:unnamed protein product [Nezara viridula]
MVDFVSAKAKLVTATMKYIAAFFLFTVTVCHGLRLPSKWARAVTLGDGDECPSIFSCKDCNTVRVCHPDNSGKLVVLKESGCPAVRPWCDADSGTCTEKEPPRCGKTDDFICLKNNHYFPDENCHRFHYCDNTYTAKLFECNPNTKVFNPIKQQCDDPAETTCNSFDCTNSAVKKAKHGLFVDYYALCNKAGANAGPLVVNVCPEMYVLNTTSQLCAPDCDRYSSINIADVEDCHFYYHCKAIYLNPGDKITKLEKRQCPAGLAYDSTQFTCVDEGTVEACSKTPKA